MTTLHEGPLSHRNFPDFGVATDLEKHIPEGLRRVDTVDTLDADEDVNDLSARAVKLLNAFVVSHTPDGPGKSDAVESI